MKILIALVIIIWVFLKVKRKKKKVDLSTILHKEAKVGEDKIQNPTL